MSSNRLIYDKCAYASEIKESTGSLEYNLFKGKYDTCEKCEIGDFPAELEFGPRADTESELHGLTRPNTKCPSLKYDQAQGFKNPSLTPAKTCENIYYITPNNLEKPTSNMLNENNLAVDNRVKKEQFGNQRYVSGNYPFDSVQYQQKEQFGNQHYMPGDYPFNSIESQFKTQAEATKEMFGNQMYRPADYPFNPSNMVPQVTASSEAVKERFTNGSADVPFNPMNTMPKSDAQSEMYKENFGSQQYMASNYPASDAPITRAEVPDAYGIEAHAPWNMNVKENFDCGSWSLKKEHEQFGAVQDRTAAGQACAAGISSCTNMYKRPQDINKLNNCLKPSLQAYTSNPGKNATSYVKGCWNSNMNNKWLEQFDASKGVVNNMTNNCANCMKAKNDCKTLYKTSTKIDNCINNANIQNASCKMCNKRETFADASMGVVNNMTNYCELCQRSKDDCRRYKDMRKQDSCVGNAQKTSSCISCKK